MENIAAATITGVVAAAPTEPTAKGVTLANSGKTGRPRTTTIGTAAERLEILQQALWLAKEAGLPMKLTDLRPNRSAVGILLYDVSLCGTCHNLFLGEICPHCHK